MIKIGIGLNSISYSPEAYAYSNFLESRGYEIQLDNENKLDPNNELNIYFMGIRPFWKRERGRALEIHEYQSLSTPPYSKFKDGLKGVINKKPAGRIFLNNNVKNNLNFRDRVSSLLRDMGVDDALFQKTKLYPEYDVLYCGSIAGRAGLIEELSRLARMGLKLLIVGDVAKDTEIQLKKIGKIDFTGRVQRNELPELYRNAKAGLNYTPDIFPFNIQTSTKTLEYLASGMKLISNKYEWSEVFTRKHEIPVLWTEDCVSLKVFQCHLENNERIDMSMYEWDSVLKGCKLERFIVNCLDNS